jgi:hypothetical protein
VSRAALLVGLTLVVAAAVFSQPPLPQDPAYHGFADRRTILGAPNGLNVWSNVAFVLVGAAGLAALGSGRVRLADRRERWFYGPFFVAVALVGPGSAYYHWAPDNARLVWDRLPMTLAFMSLFAAIIAERIGMRSGLALLGPLQVAGVASVVHWHLTELRGAGDLRAYILVQFYPMLAIPLLLLLFPARYTRGKDFVTVLGLYGAAKLLELGDARVSSWLHGISGHTLKHVVSAAACYVVLRMLARRDVKDPLGRRPSPVVSSAQGTGPTIAAQEESRVVGPRHDHQLNRRGPRQGRGGDKEAR